MKERLMVSKDAEREMARRMRAQGLSLNEIAVQVGVAKSSVSTWVRDIRLSASQADALIAKRRADGAKVGGWGRGTRLARWQAFYRQAEEEYTHLSQDPDFMFGLALYIGEGAKSDGNVANVTNCDPRVIRKAIRFFEDIGVTRERIKCQVFIHADCDEAAVRRFWTEQTGLTVNAHLIRSDSRSSRRSKPGRQPYGTCRVLVCSTQVRQKLEQWMAMSLRG